MGAGFPTAMPELHLGYLIADPMRQDGLVHLFRHKQAADIHTMSLPQTAPHETHSVGKEYNTSQRNCSHLLWLQGIEQRTSLPPSSFRPLGIGVMPEDLPTLRAGAKRPGGLDIIS